jgi:hypothetical protein
VKIFVLQRFGKYQMQVNTSLDEMIFNFGSLIYPKEMLKLLQFQTEAKMKVINIYNYLYKFSLERLQQLLNNESLMLFLLVYLELNKY